MRASSLRSLPALLVLAAAGCLPNATWLPDSSGFVYTGGKNKDALYRYDLDKKAPRVLVKKGAGPAWPAVSADGKRIAVVLRADDGTDVSLTVIVFDRDGKELQRSDGGTNIKMNWAKHGFVADHVAAQAFWIPGKDELLLSTDEVTGFYNLKTRRDTKLDVNLSTFGATPILPNGKGFLAIKKGNDGGPVVVDWDGKEQKIDLKPKVALDSFGGSDSPLQGMLTYPLMHASRWDGSTAVVHWGDVRVQIDPDKAVGTVEHFKPALSDDKKVIQQQVQLSGGVVVRAVELSPRYKKDLNPEESASASYRVEVLKQGAKEPKTLMDGAGFFRIDPSPDGKKAVVKCSKSLDAIFTESKPEQDMLYLIDGLGDVAAEIDLAK